MHLQERYLQRNHPTRAVDGESWATSLLTTIWGQLHDRWKTRCNLVHQGDLSIATTEATRRLQATATALYAASEQLLAADRSHLTQDLPLAERLQHPKPRLTRWITIAQHFLPDAQKRAEYHRQENTRPITTYFRPIGRTSNPSTQTVAATPPTAIETTPATRQRQSQNATAPPFRTTRHVRPATAAPQRSSSRRSPPPLRQPHPQSSPPITSRHPTPTPNHQPTRRRIATRITQFFRPAARVRPVDQNPDKYPD